MSILRWIYRFRGVLVSPPLIFALVSFAYETEIDAFIWPLGSILFLLGFGLRLWAQQHLHYRLKVAKELTATGPYAFVRNPIYIGNTLICLGATVVSELLWFVPVTLVWCISIYACVVRYEEQRLFARYGEVYQRYRLDVPRWLPRTVYLRNIGLVNSYFRVSLIAEMHCLLIFLLYLMKEIISPWFE